jgi:hypothetical protein
MKTGCLVGCGALMGLVALVFLATLLGHPSTAPVPTPRSEAPALAEEEARKNAPDALRDLEVNCTWEKSGFGAVALGNVTIKNKSKHRYSDVVVVFTFAGQSDTS